MPPVCVLGLSHALFQAKQKFVAILHGEFEVAVDIFLTIAVDAFID
jgi:hypothetical protein